MNAYFKKISFLLLGALCICITSSSHAFADIDDLTVQTGCSNLPTYTGLLDLDETTYDVYVKLAKRGESASVSAYTQSSFQGYGECGEVGTVSASGDRWTKAGSFDATDDGPYTIQLSSSALDRIPDANRPSVMLVPQKTPACIPDIECEVMVQGQKGFLQPTGVLLNQDSLHVLKVEPLRDADIKEVRYFVDSRLAYTKPSLEAFDMRYVLYPNQKLQRVAIYKSGQRVILESNSPGSHTGSFGDFLFGLSRAYPATYRFVGWGLGVFLALFALFIVVKMILKRRTWEYDHGFLTEKSKPLTAAQLERAYIRRRAVKWFGWTVSLVGILVGIGLMVVLLNTYIMQIFTVDGRSMQQTLKTGDQVLINKFAKTFAAVNGREYLPLRGEIVVVRGVFGNAALTTKDTANELYLIKRVIALPGERVVIKDGVLTVYNKEHPKGFQPDKGSDWEEQMTRDLPSENLDVQLSTSELFVSGDNRPESIDSRFNGPLATKEVIGPMMIRIWPIR